MWINNGINLYKLTTYSLYLHKQFNQIMKSEIFNQYVDKVCVLFMVRREELFTKCKRREVVDARHMLYYLCYKRPMPIVSIMRYMSENGYEIKHSSIIHGIAKVEYKIRSDRDYVSVIREAEKTVFI